MTGVQSPVSNAVLGELGGNGVGDFILILNLARVWPDRQVSNYLKEVGVLLPCIAISRLLLIYGLFL